MEPAPADVMLVDEHVEDREAVRARLATRGLLRRSAGPAPVGGASDDADDGYVGRHFAAPEPEAEAPAEAPEPAPAPEQAAPPSPPAPPPPPPPPAPTPPPRIERAPQQPRRSGPPASEPAPEPPRRSLFSQPSPTPQPRRSLFSDAPPDAPGRAAGEGWDVQSQGGNPVEIACPRCARSRLWPRDVTRFRCEHCERAWRWATCDSCANLALAQERLESWQCRGCGAYTRSWWRTASAQREAGGIAARLRELARERERTVAAAAARRRHRRLRIVLAAALVAAASTLALVRLAEPTKAAGTAVVCQHFDRLRSGLASGTVASDRVPGELAALSREAEGADPAVAGAVDGLAAAGSPAGADFLVASTALSDACAAAGS